MRTLVRLGLVAIAAALVWAAFAWPRLASVETGHTPEYPDLKPQEYAAKPAVVAKAVTEAIAAMPGWTVVGSGSGPGGSKTQVQARTPIVQIPSDLFIHVRTEKGRSVVIVKSEWRYGPWDFGQGARNIRAFQAELDRHLHNGF
jgi:uncharacterized protein (DUF1499 family)